MKDVKNQQNLNWQVGFQVMLHYDLELPTSSTKVSLQSSLPQKFLKIAEQRKVWADFTRFWHPAIDNRKFASNRTAKSQWEKIYIFSIARHPFPRHKPNRKIPRTKRSSRQSKPYWISPPIAESEASNDAITGAPTILPGKSSGLKQTQSRQKRRKIYKRKTEVRPVWSCQRI